MFLYNIDNTKDDKHKSGKTWIDVLAEFKKIFRCKDISTYNRVGAHMSDHPNDDLLKGNLFGHKWYIVSVPNDGTNSKLSNEKIQIDHNDYEEYKTLKDFNA